jgi:curved DNA-binding protein CbpA
MRTLYDLLGALPGDDADGLRAAFRRAAKATHPDMNPDDPEAPRRFRELVRAYDILIDTDQRTTYDELLLIALQPPPAAKSTRVYERVRKYASNTMAATIISGLLVAGYTLFGHFSKPPGPLRRRMRMPSMP